MEPGINICSNTKGLGGALTNPTCLSKKKGNIVQDYPIIFRGVSYPDAETAYQSTKRNSRPMSFEELQDLLVRVDVVKFRTHPRLVEAITKNGGVEWLKTCWHRTGARTQDYSRWEGYGVNSATIRVLIRAYEIVTTPPEALFWIGWSDGGDLTYDASDPYPDQASAQAECDRYNRLYPDSWDDVWVVPGTSLSRYEPM